MLEVPVYVITGFLEGGKTTFIREVLASPDFADGEKTILICCEEGEEEYDVKEMNRHNIEIETVEEEQYHAYVASDVFIISPMIIAAAIAIPVLVILFILVMIGGGKKKNE